MDTYRKYIPFGRPNFSEEEIEAVSAVLRSGWIGMGGETIAFEKELAEFMNVPNVITVNSCTSALFLSLLAAGVKAGDEVIVPSLTWCATANVALYLGAKVVFADVDRETFSLSAETIKAKLSPKTKAVVVVHYGGYAVDMDAVRAVLPTSVAIVEDCAHALGSRYASNRMVGSSGNICSFSFYANKNLSTGEGGAVAIFDKEVADHLRSLRQNGTPIDAWKRYINPKSPFGGAMLSELGYKMNYTDLQACIGRVQLRRQPEFKAIRQHIAERYVNELGDIFTFQKDIVSENNAKHLFPVLLRSGKLSRNDLVAALRQANIGASIHYVPLHVMPLYHSNASLPVTEEIAENILTLPISASLTEEELDFIITAIKEICL